jgi:hypothetical protein
MDRRERIQQGIVVANFSFFFAYLLFMANLPLIGIIAATSLYLALLGCYGYRAIVALRSSPSDDDSDAP